MLATLIEILMSRLAVASVQSLLLVAALWLLCRAWPGLPASSRSVLWWLAALQLLLGLLWPTPLELPLLPSTAAAAPAVMEGAAATAAATPRAGALAAQMPQVLMAVPPQDAISNGWPAFSWGALLAWIWLSGVIMTAVQSLFAYRQARQWRLSARPCERADVLAIYRAVGHSMGLPRLPPLRLSDDIHSPQLLGPWQPLVLLPAAAVDTLAASELQMALRHELTHLRRRDLWWGWAPTLARHLFFFHPAAYLIAREYAFAREAACDESVLAGDHHSPQDYGRLLLRLGVSPRPCAGMAGASPTYTLLKRRLVMLQNTGNPPRFTTLALVAGIIVLGVLPYRVIASADSAPPAPAATPSAVPSPTPQARPAAVAAPAVSARPAARPMAATAAAPAARSSTTSSSSQVTRGRVIRNGSAEDYAYVLMEGGHVTASAEAQDFRAARQARGASTEPMLWLRKRGETYLVKDPAVVNRAQNLWQPMTALGEQQGKLGEQQGGLGGRQGALGQQMGKLGEQMGQLGVQQATLATQEAALAMKQGAEADRRLAEIDKQRATLDARMAALDRQQAVLSRQQAALGEQQAALGERQAALGEQQSVASDRAHREMQKLIDDAIDGGVAQRLDR